MRLQAFSGALALSSAALAFSDSSPLVLLSSSQISKPSNTNQIQSSAEVLEFTKDFLSSCPTNRYLIIQQPGLHATDLNQRRHCSLPHLCKAVEDDGVKGQYTVAEVVGTFPSDEWRTHIQSSCSKKKISPEVTHIRKEAIPSHSNAQARSQALIELDTTIGGQLRSIMAGNSYTIMLISAPAEPRYEPDFVDSVHSNMKRSQSSAVSAQDSNDSVFDQLPLFEKYQFFTPGIFMAILVALILLSILGVGIKGLASLEVPYGAFDKEMGPAAQKKQQ